MRIVAYDGDCGGMMVCRGEERIGKSCSAQQPGRELPKDVNSDKKGLGKSYGRVEIEVR
mgnify:CR=1 FL=1